MAPQIIKTSLLIFTLISVALFSDSCYYDKEELLYPDTLACDTLAMSYSSDIAPIFSTHCYGCHSNARSQSAGAGISLEGHANVSSYVSNNANRLLGAMRREPGFSPMPKGGAKLADCDINKISSWIDAGAKNN